MRRTQPQSGAARVSVRLLGGFAVCAGDRVVVDYTWKRGKAKAILKLMALQPRRALHREQLIEVLWPELDLSAAANNLRKNLHYLRSALAEGDLSGNIVAAQGDLLMLSPEVEVDVELFHQRAREAREQRDPGLYEQTLGLYAGDLLPEDLYEEWTEPSREELRALRNRLLLEVSQLHQEAGRFERAEHHLQQLLQVDPANEDAHRTLMRLYAHSGARHRAVGQYQRCREALQRELGLEPSPETDALYRQVAATGRQGQVATGPGPPNGGSRAPARASQLSQTRPERERGAHVPRGNTSVTSTPLSGRADELRQTLDLLALAARGQGQVLFVRGVAGIGKSCFAEHVLDETTKQGGLAFTGRSYELEAATAYQPVREMLDQAVASVPGVGDSPLIQHSLHLRWLLSDTVEAPTELSPSLDPALLRAELFEEISRLFETIAAQRPPLVLFFDDVHAADDASIRLLHFLARQAPSFPVFILCTYRPEESTPGRSLTPLLSSLKHEHLVREVSLAPLPDDAMRSLVKHLFPTHPAAAELVQDVVQRAEGNPLFATQLVQTLTGEGIAQVIGGRWQRPSPAPLPVPGAVQDLLDRRLERLSAGARNVLNVVAVAGHGVGYELLRTALPIAEQDILAGLDDCLAAHLLLETDQGYRFHHNLLREGVYTRLTSARRRQLHRAIATALSSGAEEPSGARAEVVGRHFAQSDEPWCAVPYLHNAARHAASIFANEHAMQLFESAIAIWRTAPSRLEPRPMAALLEDLGDLSRRGGDAERSARLFEEALILLHGVGDEHAVLRVRGKAALGHIVRGDVHTAANLLDTTLRSMTEQSPESVVSRTYYLLAQLRWHSGQHQEALAAAERALMAAEAVGDPAQRARAYEALALACHSLGDWQRGVEYELARQALGTPGFDTDEAFDAHL